MTIRRKLIEVALPLDAINKAAAREKSIRHGHPSTLHLWWARRPLAACRAVLFAQMVDDPSAWPDRFRGEAAQKAERDRLHDLIERLVPWEASTNLAVLNEARWEIARSFAWGRGEEPPAKDAPDAVLAYLAAHAPPVCDPFCGGGSIPLEAQRLGLRAIASDLNPVAVLITKALVEIPPKFAGLAPVHPDSRAETARGGQWQGRGAAGLAEDVRRYGGWMRDEAWRRIGHLYPLAELPDGSKATVIAWIWARTVRSPNPVAKGAMVPLAASFLLSAKPGREAWLAPQIDPAAGTYSFDVRVSGTKAQLDTARQGTKTARGANFSCILTSTPISGDYIKAEGVAGRLGVRLLAIVAEGERGRIYLPPTAEMETVASNAQSTWQPEQGLPDDLRNIWVTIYGFKAFGDLFTPRQAVALTTFADLVDEARARIVEDSAAAELPDDPRPLAEGGTGANAYADAVATYLALCIGRCADFWSSLATWSSAPKNELVVATFRRQALPMTWDFGEVNPFSDSGGNFTGNLRLVAKALDAIETSAPGVVIQSNAQRNAIRTGVSYSSDPPYYDNIGYADLSDFFYVWLRRAAGRIYPALFGTLLTPKTEELIASPYRHGGREAAERFFLAGMQGVMRRMAEAATPEAPITLYYAFKQSETNDEGVASTGWATFLQAVHEAGLIVDGTWPIRTERAARSISIGTNALASSIVLVCRRRAPDAPAIARGAFLAALRRELPPAARLLRASGIAATDFEQAIIGPGMEVFTRHRAVLDSDDTAMPVKTALALINQVLDEDEADVDAATRFALTWFATHGFDERPYGDADNLARARDVGVDAMTQVGLLVSGRGRVRLKRRDEWPDGFDAAVSLAADAPAWMMANALAHALDTGGEATAGALLGRLGARAEPARDLAYRVFLLSERKKLAAEAGVWNALAVAWPDLIDRAREAAERAAPAQAALAI